MKRLTVAVGCLALAVTAVAQESDRFVRVKGSLVALTHVRVIDGTGAAPQEDQTLVLEKGLISHMGASGSVSVPAGAETIDLKGATVIPGLVGMHEHMYYPAPGNVPSYPEHLASFPALYLAGGVTSARTAGSVEPYTDLEIKRLVDSGKLVGPKLHLTGPYLEGPGAYTPQMHQLKDSEDARRTVEYWISEGITSFKAYMHLTPDELSAVIRAAHAHNLKVTGHLCSIGFREAAALGIDNLEHGLLVDTEFFSQKKPGLCPDTEAPLKEMADGLAVDGPAVQATIHDLVNHHVAVTSTLPVFETLVPNRPPVRQAVLDVMTTEAQNSYLVTRARIAGQSGTSSWPILFKKEMEFERAFVKSGGLLLAGLDPTGYGGVVAGFGDQREVELLVEAGFSPIEAIHIATANGASFLGESDTIGSLAPGKAADLVVLRGDPSTKIEDIEKVEIVFKDGVGYDPAKIIASVRGSVGLE